MRRLKKIIAGVKRKGLSGTVAWIGNKLNPGLARVHLRVVGYEDASRITAPPCGLEFEMARVTLGDEQEIDELTLIDEWHIPKSVTLEKLEEGWGCYVAKEGGRIAASVWVALVNEFEDSTLKRTFVLAPNESYYWRGFSLPEFRGKGLLPSLQVRMSRDVASTYGRDRGLAINRVGNRAIHRVNEKMGWSILGYVGFVQLFGVRFHYLWGRGAFPATRKRFLVRRVR